MITRHNYEEFFVLYVDKELSAGERQIVDAFVAENPDLRAELDILAQCRLDPEGGLFFKDKASLIRQAPEASAGGPIIGKEQLYLYIDKELDEVTRASVEDLAAMDQSILRELTLLKMTLNEPDPKLIFRNKELLYRKEKEKRIVLLPFLRIAAAAIVLGAIGLIVFNAVRKSTRPSIVLAPRKKIQEPVTLARVDTLYSSTTRQDAQQDQLVKIGIQRAGAADGSAQQKVMNPDDRQRKRDGGGDRDLASKEMPADRVSLIKPVNTRRAELIKKDGNATPEIAISVQPLPVRLENSPLALTDRSGAVPETGNTKRSSFATEALLKESDLPIADIYVETGNDGMGAVSSSKNRLRGVFRKVTRVFEKTTSRDDDDDKHRILIGNLQMALK
jgi:hypothetical protein